MSIFCVWAECKIWLVSYGSNNTSQSLSTSDLCVTYTHNLKTIQAIYGHFADMSLTSNLNAKKFFCLLSLQKINSYIRFKFVSIEQNYHYSAKNHCLSSKTPTNSIAVELTDLTIWAKITKLKAKQVHSFTRIKMSLSQNQPLCHFAKWHVGQFFSLYGTSCWTFCITCSTHNRTWFWLQVNLQNNSHFSSQKLAQYNRKFFLAQSACFH